MVARVWKVSTSTNAFVLREGQGAAVSIRPRLVRSSCGAGGGRSAAEREVGPQSWVTKGRPGGMSSLFYIQGSLWFPEVVIWDGV